MQRVHRVQSAATNGRVGYCLDAIDLFMSKAVAGRDKDREFCMALLRYGHVDADQAMAMVAEMPAGGRRSTPARCDHSPLEQGAG